MSTRLRGASIVDADLGIIRIKKRRTALGRAAGFVAVIEYSPAFVHAYKGADIHQVRAYGLTSNQAIKELKTKWAALHLIKSG